jgi:hypothetical protein
MIVNIDKAIPPFDSYAAERTCYDPDVWLGWLAGLLEGEGCFQVKTKEAGEHGRVTTRRYPSISLKMTDEDTVELAASLMGGNAVRWLPMAEPRKDQYITLLMGSRAESVMRNIFPFMGERRKTRIREIFEECGCSSI